MLLTDKLEVQPQPEHRGVYRGLGRNIRGMVPTEGTLSIHPSSPHDANCSTGCGTLHLCTGPAAGDLATEALGLGFNVGVAVFSALIAAIAVAYFPRRKRGPDVLAGLYPDAVPSARRSATCCPRRVPMAGSALGTVHTSLAFLVVIVALVAFISVDKSPAQKRKAATGRHDPTFDPPNSHGGRANHAGHSTRSLS